MTTNAIDVRLAVVEHETRNTQERMDRELATKADIERAENRIIRWMVGLLLGVLFAQPVVWLGAINAARRLGLL